MNFLFELYKDNSFKNSEHFRKELKEKYNLTDEQLSELYVMISKYQVNKYGQTLDSRYIIHTDHKRVTAARRARRAQRKHGR